LAQTVLQHKQPGDTINIECDLLGKYVEHLLSYGRSGGESSTSTAKSPSKLSAAFLAENGFL
jgi:riboflavin synthase